MGESVIGAKDNLQKTLDELKNISIDNLSKVDSTDISISIQKAQNILVQNEKKIWLKTKDGKEMVGRIEDASYKLLTSVQELQKSKKLDSPSLSDLKEALKKLELNVRLLDEESRRRGMVVT